MFRPGKTGPQGGVSHLGPEKGTPADRREKPGLVRGEKAGGALNNLGQLMLSLSWAVGTPKETDAERLRASPLHSEAPLRGVA